VVGAQRLFADGKAALVERLGLEVEALGMIEEAQPRNGCRELRVLCTTPSAGKVDVPFGMASEQLRG
jgi:hypothetical protein